MANSSGIPYIEAQFDKHQDPLEPDQTATINTWVEDQGITDLIVMCHGWNNDIAEARQLYAELAASIAAVIASGSGNGLPNRTLGLLGIFWPSKKFAEDDLIPGGAASTRGELDDRVLLAQLEGFKGFFDADSADTSLNDLGSLVQDIESDPEAREQFFRTARTLIGAPDDLDPDDRDEIPDLFFSADTADEIAELFDELKKPDPPGVSTTSTSSGAVGLSLSGFKAGARRLLNYLTYYQMKKRARKAGVEAVQPLLRTVRQSHSGLRIHLVGHSFGGLLVTSTSWGGDGNVPTIPVETMTLLQAAFSHNGFAKDFHDGRDGRYRKVLEESRVTGPILVTHTQNDKAVGIAYALASRFAGQDAADIGIGRSDDRFGGIGANGAQHTPEAVESRLKDAGEAYSFETAKLYGLLADDHISDHSDVRGKAVAHVIVEGIASIA